MGYKKGVQKGRCWEPDTRTHTMNITRTLIPSNTVVVVIHPPAKTLDTKDPINKGKGNNRNKDTPIMALKITTELFDKNEKIFFVIPLTLSV